MKSTDDVKGLASPEQAAPVDHYEELERQHLGDFDKRTGIYAPSAETIDTAGLTDLMAKFEAACLSSVSERAVAFKDVLDWHSARMAAARQEGIAIGRGNAVRDYVSLNDAAAREQALEEADHDKAVRLLGIVFDAWENGDPCYEDADPSSTYLGTAFRLDDEVFNECCELLNRRNPPRNAASQTATHPAPAAGLTDWQHVSNEWADTASSALVWLMSVRDGISNPADAIANVKDSIAHCRALAAQQPAQAVAKDEKQGGLVEQIKQQVMARLAHRGLLSDLSHNGVRIIGYELLSDVERVVAEFGIAPMCQQAAIKAMVDRFLGWPIPKSFSPDCGISFDGRKDDQWNKNKPWPIGTNLLNADEARQMFEYVLQGAAPLATHEGKVGDAADGGQADDWKLVMDEVERATRKFPTWPTDPLHAVAVLGEEFGELTKAVLQTTYEPHKVQDGELRTEAIQTAAMSLRFLASLGRYEFTRSVQHEQQAQQAGKAGA